MSRFKLWWLKQLEGYDRWLYKKIFMLGQDIKHYQKKKRDNQERIDKFERELKEKYSV